MKANIPKSFQSLPPREKQIIQKMMEETVSDQIDKEEAKLQKIWLQFACIVLHEAFGFGERRCVTFLGNWKRIYRQNAKFKTEEEQTAWIDERINKIFPDGYPSEFIDSLEGQTKN